MISATSCGCAANVALAGRAEPSLSASLAVDFPLTSPEAEGDLGLEMVLAYDEFLTDMEHTANLSEGRLRCQGAGAFCKLLAIRSAESGRKYLWFGVGPEYRWNSFVISDDERIAAAANGIVYDEDVKDRWGWCVFGGYDFLPWGLFLLEVSYHWMFTRTEVKGSDNGVYFRWSRSEKLQWLSWFIGLRLRF